MPRATSMMSTPASKRSSRNETRRRFNESRRGITARNGAEGPVSDTTFILLARSPDLLPPTIRARCQPIFVGGEVETNDALAASIVAALTRFSEGRDTAALLGIASLIASQEEVSDAVALLG